MFHHAPRPDIASPPLAPASGNTANSPSADIQPFVEALHDCSDAADERWRSWARQLLHTGRFTRAVAARIWAAVVEFDETLAAYLTSPIAAPDGTVVVSGSGKETFKTFNVSTAAALLAAAAGVTVVKGTSASVSAVSGSSDVLAAIGIPLLGRPAEVPEFLASCGIAFINYSAFCPRYAARYDDRFDFLSPMGFFMPTATIAVQAEAFLHGLAHEDVRTAALAIHAARPDFDRGRVVTTRLGPDQRIDEVAPFGTSTSAVLHRGEVQLVRHRRAAASAGWQRAVQHRPDHKANADALLNALRPDADPAAAGLVDLNAAAVVAAARPETSENEALQLVRRARLDGRVQDLLDRLRTTDPKGLR